MNISDKYHLIKTVIIAYLFFTLFLYFFGAIPWIVTSWPTLTIVTLCYILFFYGASSPKHYLKRRKIININFNLLKGSRLLFWSIIVISILFVRNYVYFDSLIPNPSVIIKSYTLIKDREQEFTIFSYLYFILSPVLLYGIAVLIVSRTQKGYLKIISVISILFYVYSGVITGTNNNVLEVILIISLSIYAKKKIKKNNKKKIYLGVMAIFLIASIGMGGVIKTRIGDLYSTNMPIIPNQDIYYTFNFAEESSLSATYYLMSAYMTQGYQGLQLSSDMESNSLWIPFTSSRFMVRQYMKSGILGADYQSISEKTSYYKGWKDKLRWGTVFIWLKDDIPFYFLPLFFLLTGYAFKRIIFTYLMVTTPFNLCSAMIATKYMIFVPLNAISFATGEELFRFISFIVLPLVFSKKIKIQGAR